MNRFVIVIPFYNAEKYIVRCLMSAFTQRYSEYKIVIINDASTDKTDELINELIKTIPIYCDFEYIVNERRMGAMYNHQWAVYNHSSGEDIVVHLDGDDYLSNKKVLSFIDGFYNENDCYLMYGQYKRDTGEIGTSKPFESESAFNSLRSLPFVFSHIRTFRSKLFYEIKVQDPNLSCFKDTKGNWLGVSCDVAMMTPLLEIAGYNKIKFNSKPLYVYNDKNPINDFKVKLMDQEKTEMYIRKQSPFLNKKF